MPSLSGPPSILSKLGIFSLTTLLCYLIWIPLTFPRASPSCMAASRLWFPTPSGRRGPVSALWCVASVLSRCEWRRFNFTHISPGPYPFFLSISECPYISWRTSSTTLIHFTSTSKFVWFAPISTSSTSFPWKRALLWCPGKKTLCLHSSSCAHC